MNGLSPATIRAALDRYDAAAAEIATLTDQYRGVAPWPKEADEAWQRASDAIGLALPLLRLDAIRALLAVVEADGEGGGDG